MRLSNYDNKARRGETMMNFIPVEFEFSDIAVVNQEAKENIYVDTDFLIKRYRNEYFRETKNRRNRTLFRKI